MIIVLWVLIALQVLSAIGSIALIGDARNPKTKTEAIISVIVAALLAILYLMIIHELQSK